MTELTVNASRVEPRNNFTFRVKWDGQHIAGVSKISGLRWTAEVIEHREGGDQSISRKLPGQVKFESITLERRGITNDPAFEQWANMIGIPGAGAGREVSPKDFRKDIAIDIFNEAGQLVLSYKVFRCWVSEYQALPELDAAGDAVALEHIKLENEGWQRDTSVVAPHEPRFAEKEA